MEKKQITLRLPEELHEKLTQKAKRQGLDLKSLIVVILWRHFQNVSRG